MSDTSDKLTADAASIDEIADGLAYLQGLANQSGNTDGEARLAEQVAKLHECSAFCRALAAESV